MTEIEKIYGPHAKNLNQDERRHKLDEIELLLEGSTQEKIREIRANPALSEHKKEKQIEEAEHEAERFLHQAERVLKLTTMDYFKTKGTSALIILFFSLLFEGMGKMKDAASDAGMAPTGGGGGGHGGGGHH